MKRGGKAGGGEMAAAEVVGGRGRGEIWIGAALEGENTVET